MALIDPLGPYLGSSSSRKPSLTSAELTIPFSATPTLYGDISLVSANHIVINYLDIYILLTHLKKRDNLFFSNLLKVDI